MRNGNRESLREAARIIYGTALRVRFIFIILISGYIYPDAFSAGDKSNLCHSKIIIPQDDQSVWTI